MILVCCLFYGCSSRDTGDKGIHRYEKTLPLMGTFLTIQIMSTGDDGEKMNITLDKAFHIADRLEGRFSAFDTGSEVNELNILKKNSISPQLFTLLELSKKISAITGGEFDITVAPILKDYGFYEDMPEELFDMIPGGHHKGDWRNIRLSPDENAASLENGIWVDLSGIAKGYIVEQLGQYLRSEGVEHFMINAGGDILCGGKPHDGKWLIGIRDPGSNGVLLVLGLKNVSVATSGDYENWAVDGMSGEEMAHIIDPSRSTPIKKEFSSISVISGDCSYADSLATGMMAMGPDKAIELADGLPDVDVISISLINGDFDIKYSKNAERHIMPGGDIVVGR